MMFTLINSCINNLSDIKYEEETQTRLSYSCILRIVGYPIIVLTPRFLPSPSECFMGRDL